jgi:hypothetical protein
LKNVLNFEFVLFWTNNIMVIHRYYGWKLAI